MERKQFTFYRSFYESIENLRTDKEKLQAYRLISQYALYGQLPELEGIRPSALAVFSISKPILDTARRRSRDLKSGNNLSQQE